MEILAISALLVCMLIVAAVSRRIQGTIVTLPMVCVLLGFLVGRTGLGFVHMEFEGRTVRVIAELTLVLVLATDASRIDLRRLLRDHTLPQRLLTVGLLLTMLFGTLAAMGIFPQLGLWEAAILAIILTPTDASLGQAVISNPRVPGRIRQTLNIESGLNDGIAMPFLLLVVAVALATETFISVFDWLAFTAVAIWLGALAGLVLGYVAVRLIGWGRRSGWMSDPSCKIAFLVLILLSYTVAELIGGNGFIAAFFMGATVGNLPQKGENKVTLLEHAEVEVYLLMVLTFLLFGAVMVPRALAGIDPRALLYAVLSLTAVRMVPVAISLVGSGVRPATTAFLGWFGPRGTASILYVFTVLEAEPIPGFDLIVDVVLITVLLSVFVHGVTAAPLAGRYGRYMSQLQARRPDGAEMQEASEIPLRAHPT